jgi:hypothetical protein
VGYAIDRVEAPRRAGPRIETEQRDHTVDVHHEQRAASGRPSLQTTLGSTISQSSGAVVRVPGSITWVLGTVTWLVLVSVA